MGGFFPKIGTPDRKPLLKETFKFLNLHPHTSVVPKVGNNPCARININLYTGNHSVKAAIKRCGTSE